MKGIQIKVVLLTLIVFLSFGAIGQKNNYIDSLKTIVLDKTATDSNTSVRYYLIARYYSQNNKDSSLYYWNKLEKFATKNKSNYGMYFVHFYKVRYLRFFIPPKSDSTYNFVVSNMKACIKYARKEKNAELVCRSYHRIASEERARGNSEQLIHYGQKALDAALEYDDKPQIAKAYMLQGFHYLVDYEEFEKSMFFMLKADSMFSKYDLNKDDRATNIANLGNLYYHLDNKKKALAHYQKALKLLKETNNKFREHYVLGRVAKLYLDEKNYEEGIKILHKCYDYYKSIKKYGSWKANALRLSLAYSKTNQIEKSIKYANIAIDIAQKRGYPSEIAEAILYKSELKYTTGDYLESYNIALEAKQVAEEIDSPHEMNNALRLLHKSSSKLGKHQESYKHLLEYKKISDKIKKSSNLKNAQELEAKYQTAKNEQEIAQLKSQKELALKEKKNQQNLLIGGGVLAALGGLLFIFLYLNKQKINRKLTELNKAKTTFFENISHEFRTPLTLIKLPVSKALNEDIGLSKQHLNTIHSNASRLQALVEDLLTLAEMDAGKLSSKKTEQNPLKQALILTSQFNSYAESSGIEYCKNIQKLNIIAKYDSSVVLKTLSNLVTNAIKYSNKGGSVLVDVYIDNDNLVMKVADNGEGISVLHQTKIFDRFYQINEKDETIPGTGIGLSLVKKMLELNDGTISVKSKKGEGSTFTAILPLEKVRISNDVAENNEILPVSALNYQQDIKPSFDLTDNPELLIVEDNLELLQYIKELFEKEYKIHTATNGREGLEKALELVPDFIISDWMMPEMDGIKLCEKIKTNSITSHIPFLMLTAKVNVADKITGYETGADAYFSKPFNYLELQAQIKSILNQQVLLKERFKSSYEIKPEKIAVNNYDEIFWENFLSLLNDNLGDHKFSVDMMAKHLLMSRMQLNRKVKMITGISPGIILTKQRMKIASILLKEKDSRISEVSLEVGYIDPQSFSRTFKKEFSMTPSEYKNKKEEKH